MLIVWFLLQHYNALSDNEELEQVKCFLKEKPGANKVNVGKWLWSEATLRPSWDAIAKAPIWFGDEWECFCIIIEKRDPATTFMRSAEDKERTLALGEGDKRQISISFVLCGKPVAQKLGALNYCRNTLEGPISFRRRWR